MVLFILVSYNLCHSSKQIVQRYLQNHLFYHILKLGSRCMFTIHTLYLRKDSFSHPPTSISFLLFPFEKIPCLRFNLSVSHLAVFGRDDGILSYLDSWQNPFLLKICEILIVIIGAICEN